MGIGDGGGMEKRRKPKVHQARARRHGGYLLAMGVPEAESGRGPSGGAVYESTVCAEQQMAF